MRSEEAPDSTRDPGRGSLRYAPANELGVVFLFAHLAKRWRLKVDTLRASFPDRIAFQQTQRGGKRTRMDTRSDGPFPAPRENTYDTSLAPGEEGVGETNP